MGRHARSPEWMPSDRGLTIMLVWEGFGTVVLTAALLVIALIGLGASSASGPSITQVPLAVAMQRLAVTAEDAMVAIRQVDEQLGQLGNR